MELGIIKNDVIGELRSTRYFNETEITRLVQTDTIPHKDRVLMIAELTRQNVIAIEAVKLIELYFPAAPAPAKQQETPTETVA